MLFPQISVLLWGNLLLAGAPARGQLYRLPANGRVAKPPPDIVWLTTAPAHAWVVGSTASVTTSASVESSTSTAATSVSPNPTSATTTPQTSIRNNTQSLTIPASVSTNGSGSSFTTVQSSTSRTEETSSAAPTDLERRAAIPACLKSTEASCYNLAANCIDSVYWDNRNNIWGIKSCVAAATCYGVGDLMNSVNCQTGFTLENPDEGNLDYNIYASIVGSCAWDPNGCPITGQNYIDFYYSMLSEINTGAWPSDVNVVIGFWNPILSWAATGTTIPYTNFNDWLHYSSYPSPPPTITYPPAPSYTPVPWNPNPAPPAGAVSQTFVRSETTIIIAVPTVTTTVTIAGATITLAPGGTPVGSLLPSDVTQPGAVTPTFNYNPIPPPTASSVTFVSGTWTSVVAAPTATDSPVTVNGPPDDGDDDDSNDSWLLVLGLLGLFLLGNVPASVTVVGSLTPAPTPPPDWVDPGSWTPPPPIVPPGGGDPEDPEDPEDPDEPLTCTFSLLPPYDLPYDGEGEVEDGEDEFVRRTIDYGNYGNISKRSVHMLFKRTERKIIFGPCTSLQQTFTGITLGAATWYTINPPNVPAVPSSNTLLYTTLGATHVVGDGKVAEHLFEFRYIKDFFNDQFVLGDCNWLQQNVWNFVQPGGALTPIALKNAIDQTANLVWVAEELNVAKSYISNNAKPNAGDPPLAGTINGIGSLDPAVSGNTIWKVETLIRAFGALGQYFNLNSAALRDTAGRVQNIFAQVTPATAIYPPLDTRFNNAFRAKLSTFSNGITSRGVNTYDYYIAKMNALLQTAIINNPPGNPVPTVPACFPVYHDTTIRNRLANGGINWANFVPAPIQHPACNVAGQSGSFILYYDAVTGAPVIYVGDPQFQIAATGTQYSFLWQRPPNARSFYAVDLSGHYGNLCASIVHVTHLADGQTFPLATWDQDCNGATGPATSNLYVVDTNQNRLQCYINNFNDGSNRFAIDCGPSLAAVQTCIGQMNQVDNLPAAYISTPFLRLDA